MSENRPLEFYGQSVEQDADWQEILSHEHCPFLNAKCVKVRKSDATQSIGACIVSYSNRPLIICPFRLQQSAVFLNTVPLVQHGTEFYIISQIGMPGGTVDYFLVSMNGLSITDYLGIETQSLDTTQSSGIWDARTDLARGRLGTNRYGFGINWKMSAKTILIQMHHKAAAFEELHKKFVLVIQRDFFEYMTRVFRTAHVREATDHDSVHFHIYDCIRSNNRFEITLVDRRSTDVRGIEEMLNLREHVAISESAVLEKIRAKLPSATRLRVANE